MEPSGSANLGDANLGGAIGIATPEEEAMTMAACIEAIAADPAHWRQAVWHEDGYSAADAPSASTLAASVARPARASSESAPARVSCSTRPARRCGWRRTKARAA